MAPGLHLFGLLTAADVLPLHGYCTSFARWKTAPLETLPPGWRRTDPAMHGFDS